MSNVEDADFNQQKRLSSKMTVYSYNMKKHTKREHRVPSNITALDLAFEFQSELAKCATGCYVRRDTCFSLTDAAQPLCTLLSDGDIVSYIADYYGPNEFQYHVTIDSFLSVTTTRAKVALVDYFKKHFQQEFI